MQLGWRDLLGGLRTIGVLKEPPPAVADAAPSRLSRAGNSVISRLMEGMRVNTAISVTALGQEGFYDGGGGAGGSGNQAKAVLTRMASARHPQHHRRRELVTSVLESWWVT